MIKKLLKLLVIALISCLIVLPLNAQILVLPELNNTNTWLPTNNNSAEVSACIRLDGLCLFEVSATASDIAERVQQIEQRLHRISNLYFYQQDATLTIEKRTVNNLPNIHVKVNDLEIRLLTITSLDIKNQGVDLETKAQEIIEQVQEGLERGRKERELVSLVQKGLIAFIIFGLLLILNFLVLRLIKRLNTYRDRVAELRINQPISTELTRRQQWNIREVQYRLLQLLEVGLWLGATLVIVGLFPYTRIAQIWLITLLRIPARITIVGLGTYLLIRLSYALIAKLSTLLFSQDVLDFEFNQRLQLRLRTISLVSRSIITIIWVMVGIIVALSVIGVNIAPLLAGVGILGVAVSLASQNLIRDAINGFFIIVEDQYAVGDIIQVGQFSGLVENINLRITQLRDSEGRLITIPNSEVKIVANLSSNWSRADLSIPVAYESDIDEVLTLVHQVAEEMTKDKIWQENILETPEILGVDNFSERGLIIRVWIKTKPLKQWDISREFRRRLKIAFDRQGLPLSLPQQKLWLTNI
ncbi:MscS Mechanosensitive ion channel [Rippkaea orientalis PCC 8801]|uniref:MscS Mechanosensitive ion channel n=1 Tax=Rippkaea orientalis (strain PCC 8801 / RF-1) TaxID=41431 RepID=B7K5J7_RIPO1|nr:mechanosensitive ion channel family protein [Rippkaea orientalis]ACK66730.1 MscS Mechanosensitive ion channel [Rippkaea orientalis PCC 8801]